MVFRCAGNQGNHGCGTAYIRRRWCWTPCRLPHTLMRTWNKQLFVLEENPLSSQYILLLSLNKAKKKTATLSLKQLAFQIQSPLIPRRRSNRWRIKSHAFLQSIKSFNVKSHAFLQSIKSFNVKSHAVLQPIKSFSMNHTACIIGSALISNR